MGALGADRELGARAATYSSYADTVFHHFYRNLLLATVQCITYFMGQGTSSMLALRRYFLSSTIRNANTKQLRLLKNWNRPVNKHTICSTHAGIRQRSKRYRQLEGVVGWGEMWTNQYMYMGNDQFYYYCSTR
jgi:hypothetical protein